ncbi:MAG: radical SAM peptide maturase, CXXX-repeat target family [Muribaculaceae bacterium]|nr:radical SAM peptide maturase, CXXX-repeat target family [Muribaculaceae bacterium]
MGNIKDEAAQWLDGTAANITFIVTKDCQLACKYCYLVGKNDKERMSFLTAKKAIDYILTSSLFFGRQKSVILDFIGGEPLLEVELIDKICDYFKLQTYIRGHKWFDAYRINLTTNGLNYHTKKVRKFIEKNITHLSITITIDGNEIKHDLNRVYKNSGKGSYKNVLKNIPLWLKDFKDIGTKVTISSADIPYIKESVLHLFSLGIHHLYTNCVFEDVWKEGDDKLFEEQLSELADIIIDNEYYKDFTCSFFSENIGKPLDPILENQNWCGAGKMLAVDAAGMFYPCTRFAGYSLREKKPIIIGNVRDGIDKNKLRPFLTLDRTTQSPQKCLDCEVASGCAWCQGENYDAAETNTIYQRATAICLMHKARVRANNYYWNKLYRKLELEGQREEFEKNKRKVKPVDC